MSDRTSVAISHVVMKYSRLVVKRFNLLPLIAAASFGVVGQHNAIGGIIFGAIFIFHVGEGFLFFLFLFVLFFNLPTPPQPVGFENLWHLHTFYYALFPLTDHSFSQFLSFSFLSNVPKSSLKLRISAFCHDSFAHSFLFYQCK